MVHFNPYFSVCVGVGFTQPEVKEPGALAQHGSALAPSEELLSHPDCTSEGSDWLVPVRKQVCGTARFGKLTNSPSVIIVNAEAASPRSFTHVGKDVFFTLVFVMGW